MHTTEATPMKSECMNFTALAVKRMDVFLRLSKCGYHLTSVSSLISKSIFIS
jgi:hypothetical protein